VSRGDASVMHQTEQLKIVIVGHVDHGKSTLVGRLFHDTGSLPDGKYEKIKAACEKRGMPFEWAFLMDGLQAERDQNITIDTAQIWFRTAKRSYVIIDAPGHKEFLKNMVTGAAQAEALLGAIDVVGRRLRRRSPRFNPEPGKRVTHEHLHHNRANCEQTDQGGDLRACLDPHRPKQHI